jgi:hypothetical protein
MASIKLYLHTKFIVLIYLYLYSSLKSIYLIKNIKMTAKSHFIRKQHFL